jgi:hypothetical protein
MREAFQSQARRQSGVLAIAIVWMLLLQFICVLLWNAGWLTRKTSLVHWLNLGVLPPALALRRLEQATAPRDRMS